MDTGRLLAVARGDQPADLLLRNAKMVNIFAGTVEANDIAICADRIAGFGPGYAALREVDLAGAYVTPGLIDAHVHIESSLCVPAQFAAAVLPHGVTSVVTDPHEIANVAGVAGIRYMAAACSELSLGVVIMAPSCVPATAMESNGARLEAEDLAPLLAEGVLHGLAEVMNYPGVTYGDPAMLAKLAAFAGRPIDGHAPHWRGKVLNAYVAAGIGSEHECTTVAEAAEKLGRGLYILIRQATNAQNLRTLLPLVTPANSRRICFCTDDRVPADLLDEGSIDFMVRQAVTYGIDPIVALQMATLNVAECYGLTDRGAIAPGRRADLLVCDDLRDLRPRQVYAGGQLVADRRPHAARSRAHFHPTASFRQRGSERLRQHCLGRRRPAHPCSRRRNARHWQHARPTGDRGTSPASHSGRRPGRSRPDQRCAQDGSHRTPPCPRHHGPRFYPRHRPQARRHSWYSRP